MYSGSIITLSLSLPLFEFSLSPLLPQLQNSSSSPRLGDITRIILEELSGHASSQEVTTDPTQVRHIVEGLLSHFFSLHQTSYHRDDVRWLLEMANLQTHWQATYLMSEIVEASGSKARGLGLGGLGQD